MGKTGVPCGALQGKISAVIPERDERFRAAIVSTFKLLRQPQRLIWRANVSNGD